MTVAAVSRAMVHHPRHFLIIQMLKHPEVMVEPLIGWSVRREHTTWKTRLDRAEATKSEHWGRLDGHQDHAISMSLSAQHT